MGLNLTDIKQAVESAQAERQELLRGLSDKEAALNVIRNLIESLSAFISSSQGLLNSAPQGRDISAIGGIKVMV